MDETETKAIVDAFHKLYYDNNPRTWANTSWFGVPTQKCPLDMWVYQEILHEIKPAAIIETGTANGGSALYLAHLCDLIGKGKIITIDVEARPNRPVHDRITYYAGSSVAEETLARVGEFIGGLAPVLVILDSDHSYKHVIKEMHLYAPLVSKNSYMIVEDSNISGFPVSNDFGPGPMEAIREFMKTPRGFTIDESREKYYLTFNPCGYLRKDI